VTLVEQLSANRVRSRVAAGFVLLVFLMGGGSRHDILSLAVLRPLAFAALLYAALVLRPGEFAAVRMPAMLLLALAGWMALQLVPLPPAMWQALPGRALLAEVQASAGAGGVWMPLSMAPSRTLNALFSLAVPMAGLLLFAGLGPARRGLLLVLVGALALGSVVLGIAQLAGAADGPLYLYRITNHGLPVGLFANRNHQALMASIAILIAFHQMAVAAPGEAGRLRRLVAGSLVVLLAAFLLVTGSRAGLLIGALVVLAGMALVYPGLSGGALRMRAVAAGLGGLMALLAGVFAWRARALSLDRLLATGSGFELREEAWPTIAAMLAEHWLAGTGFGTFELAFKQAEPLALLRPDYLNQAHNDWAQWLIEGGLPAGAILCVLLLWLARRAALLLPAIRAGRAPDAAVALLAIGACALASLVDYPLRVPSLMLVGALASGLLAAAPVPRALRDLRPEAALSSSRI
jgi:O-antigen ligase